VPVLAPASSACACEFFSAHGKLLVLELVRAIGNILLFFTSMHLGVLEHVSNILLLCPDAP
jgi:hypothetical protein